MGFYKIRSALAVGGGSVLIGADVNLYRDSANVLKTDDALTVAGAATLSGAVTANAGLSSTGTVTVTGRLVAPYATAAPTMGANGQVGVYHSTDTAKLVLRSSGTVYTIQFPTATHGTITVGVGTAGL